MKKVYNVNIEDNGAGYLVVIGKGTEQRFVIGAFSTLGRAWEHIEFLYKIESQEFTVGDKMIPVSEWVDGMKKVGFLD